MDDKDRGFSTNTQDVAYISSIEYHKYCNKDGDLMSGQGTLDMIRFSMNATVKLCSWVTKFSLRDVSAKVCTDEGPEISLSAIDMV